MENVLTVLLVEDDQKACSEIIEYIDTLDDVKLIGVTNNSTKAIEIVKDNLPQALILDLELHQGCGNGLQVLEELKTQLFTIKPYVLVTTNNSSHTTYEVARTLGADFIMPKHQDNYSSRNAIDFLRMIKDVIRTQNDRINDIKISETPENKRKRIVKRIQSELYLISVSPNLTGFNYLIDGIIVTIEGSSRSLCSQLASKYGKSEPSIERAMQNAINMAWRAAPIEDLLKHYTAKIRSDKGVPTITEFVCFYANKLRDEY